MTKVRRFLRSFSLLFTTGFRACPGFMAIALSLQVVAGLTGAIYPYGSRLFLDAVPKHDAAQLIWGALITGGLYMASIILIPIGFSNGFEIQNRSNIFLVGRIAELVNRIPGIDHFERPDHLRELDLLNQNRNVLASAPQQISSLLAQAVRLGITIALLMSVNFIFIVVPLVGLIPFFADSYAGRYRRRVDDELAEPVRLANQLFSFAATAAPAKELRIFGLSETLMDRHKQLAKKINGDMLKASRVAFLMGSLGWLTFAATFVAAILIVVIQAAHGHATPGQVLMAVILVNGLQSRVGQLVGGTGTLIQARKTAERYMWLEDYAKLNGAAGGCYDVPASIRGGIDFNHVDFAYPGAEDLVIHDLSLHLPAGTSVAIVGENGAGKTTLVKLLAGMYRPTSGSIHIDGIDISEFDVEKWRSRLAAIFQDFGRYELRAGQTVGVGDLANIDDDEKVMAALARTGGRDVVDGFEEGLTTRLGKSYKDGKDLSGGQWQKLALARGRMRDDPLLLILDEPTSSLDAQTEHAVFEQYIAAAHDSARTHGTVTVLISHRFSTVRMADLIVVVDKGSVKEVGSHEDLLRASGLYAELFRLQQRGYQ